MAKAPPVGVIDGNQVYSLREFRQRTGLGDWAMRSARRGGLQVLTIGRRRFVRGCDWLAYLADQAKQQTVADRKRRA